MGMYDILGQAQGAQAIPGSPIGQTVRMNADGVMRLQLAGGDPVSLAPGQSSDITVKVQAVYRPQYIVLQSSVGAASGVVVTSISCGTKEQIVSQNPALPVQAFGVQNILGYLQLDTIEPGVDMVISLSNTGPQQDAISVAVWGSRIDKG